MPTALQGGTYPSYFFVLDEITSPWNFNKQLFQVFRRREKKMRWVNGNVAMVFTLEALHFGLPRPFI